MSCHLMWYQIISYHIKSTHMSWYHLTWYLNLRVVKSMSPNFHPWLTHPLGSPKHRFFVSGLLWWRWATQLPAFHWRFTVFPKIVGFPPTWMVYKGSNPIKIGWFGGFSHYFWKHPHMYTGIGKHKGILNKIFMLMCDVMSILNNKVLCYLQTCYVVSCAVWDPKQPILCFGSLPCHGLAAGLNLFMGLIWFDDPLWSQNLQKGHIYSNQDIPGSIRISQDQSGYPAPKRNQLFSVSFWWEHINLIFISFSSTSVLIPVQGE